MRCIVVLLIFLLAACGDQRPDAPAGNLAFLFEAGQEGYACFRIPAIVAAPQGALLAFAEGRKHGCSDTGDIDLVMKRSEDNGLTWSDLRVIWSDSTNTSGNPAPVVDHQTGKIFLLSTWNLGEDREPEIIDEESRDTRRVFVLESSDEGLNWSEPREITTAVKDASWTWYATGPGSGIQLETGPYAGRLMVACDHIEAGTKHYYSHVIFSDDHGATWQRGGRTPQHQVNESEVVQLADDRLLLNMRNYAPDERHRKIAHSSDGGLTWSNIASDTTLIEPICQASLHRHKTETMDVVLFSNPASQTRRENMTIRASFDGGETWARDLLLHDGHAAYSDIVTLADGGLALLYEAGADQDHPYQGIVFQQLDFNWLE